MTGAYVAILVGICTSFFLIFMGALRPANKKGSR